MAIARCGGGGDFPHADPRRTGGPRRRLQVDRLGQPGVRFRKPIVQRQRLLGTSRSRCRGRVARPHRAPEDTDRMRARSPVARQHARGGLRRASIAAPAPRRRQSPPARRTRCQSSSCTAATRRSTPSSGSTSSSETLSSPASRWTDPVSTASTLSRLAASAGLTPRSLARRRPAQDGQPLDLPEPRDEVLGQTIGEIRAIVRRTRPRAAAPRFAAPAARRRSAARRARIRGPPRRAAAPASTMRPRPRSIFRQNRRRLTASSSPSAALPHRFGCRRTVATLRSSAASDAADS